MSTPAAVLHAPHDLRLEERPAPTPGPREVVVAVRAVGICGSDVHYYEHGRIGDHVVRSPMVLGHEAAGEVVALGAGVARLRVGQRVAIEPGVPCGRCTECRAGRYNLCPFVQFLATPPVDGALTGLLAVHEDFTHPLPDSMSDEAGALVEPLSVGIWACRKGGVGPGSRVLVTGAGPVGVLAMQVARAVGAAHVTVADVNPARLEQAASLGADSTVDTRTGSPSGADADVLLECSGAGPAIDAGIAALAPAGVAVLVGMGADTHPLPINVIQNRELVVTGTFRYAGTYPGAIALAASGRVQLDALVGARFALAEAERALTNGRTDPTVLKTVVTIAE